jgi:glycosyltransferase involved in cell wall biosynthesis
VKLTFVSTVLSFPWGGADALWTQTAGCALRQGHTVSVVVSPLVAPSAECATLKQAGARIVSRREHTAFRGHRTQWLRKLRGENEWLDELRQARPDLVVISQGGLTDFLVEDLLFQTLTSARIPYVIICQANEGLPLPDERVRRRAATVLRAARRVIFVSTHNLFSAHRQIAADFTNACVVQNPVTAANTIPEWPDDPELGLAVVGRLNCYDKGLDLLIDAVAETLAKENDWRLTFYGRGPSENYLRELADYRGLTGRVRFAGFVSDKFEIWARNHLLLMPSRIEGCSLAMLEALQHGRPVLASRVGGVDDWIEDDRTGYVCSPNDVRSLCETLANAWRQRTRWREMGAACRSVALNRFDQSPGDTLMKLLTNL